MHEYRDPYIRYRNRAHRASGKVKKMAGFCWSRSGPTKKGVRTNAYGDALAMDALFWQTPVETKR